MTLRTLPDPARRRGERDALRCGDDRDVAARRPGDRRALYVTMTRAKDMLVILHPGNSSYVEELYRALGTVPP